MKVFYQNGIPGYGARFYIKKEDNASKIGELLKVMCAWGNFDKSNDNENWIAYEMPPVSDYSIFKTVVIACCHRVVIGESLEQWEDFLKYCKE